MWDLKSALESIKYNGSNPIDQMNLDLNSQLTGMNKNISQINPVANGQENPNSLSNILGGAQGGQAGNSGTLKQALTALLMA